MAVVEQEWVSTGRLWCVTKMKSPDPDSLMWISTKFRIIREAASVLFPKRLEKIVGPVNLDVARDIHARFNAEESTHVPGEGIYWAELRHV